MASIRQVDEDPNLSVEGEGDSIQATRRRASTEDSSSDSKNHSLAWTEDTAVATEQLDAIEKVEPLANTRPESYSDVYRPTGRPPLRSNGGHTSLQDLYAESPEATPLATPSAPWLSGRGHSPSSSGFTPTPARSQECLKPLFPTRLSSYFDRDWVKEGYISQIHDRDDHGQLPSWKRYCYYLAPFLAVATLATYWIYFALRIRFVLAAQAKYGTTYPMAWVFIAVEITVAVPVFLQMIWAVFILKRRHRPKLRLLGDDVPTVDVLITCCGEDVDVVLDTTRATCHVDYPRDKFRVVVLDDGNDAELRQAVENMREIYENLHYRCRPKYPGVPHHFKAGNLNYGLEEVQSMPGGASQFVAALDADMIPESEWLRAIMPHLLKDSKMALACPPQLFYNVPPSDPLCQSLDFFVHISEPIKDALGVAWCTGSGYIVRRDYLQEIGNFPTGSLAEDVATSTKLLGKGYKTAYIHEPLQYGTVPDSYGSHLKQRTRWAIGTVETSFKLKFCLYGEDVRKMTVFQRFSSFTYAVLSLFNIFLLLSLFALPVVLISGNALVAYANEEQLFWLIRACFATLVTNRLCELVLFLPAGYATGQRGSRAQLWMSPYIAFSIIRSFVLPSWLGGQKQAFKPSGSLKSELNERDASARAPLFRRLRVVVWNYMAGFHIAYVYFVLAAVALSTMRCAADGWSVRERLVCLLTHAYWPPAAWIVVVSAFWIPVAYAVDPPAMPAREALLVRDGKTAVARPTPASKTTAFRPQTALFELEYFVSTALTALVFAASLFWL
ncbi:glycosyl transferase [Lineolata rhizophorae]|uniref:Glycosyl transferase n=1 Tax=Lineolata rhizophorae TaxID=578093 RepID=A0A6A6P5F8_9PEZI|nr:glycosyl transferase [Lineolata rhizophorae]